MNTRTRNRLFRLALVAGLLALFTPMGTAQAGSEDDAIAMWDAYYQNALRDLRNGTPQQKIEAALAFGAHGKSEYIRPLAEELLRDMNNESLIRMPRNDPKVKATIAWALGEIGHKHPVPELLECLEITDRLVVQDIERVREHKERMDALMARADEIRGPQPGDENQTEEDRLYQIEYVAIEPTRPGPFLDRGHRFGYSPDMNWTIADEFKAAAGINERDIGHNIRLNGANYMNLMRELFTALGKIGDESATEGLSAYLSQDKAPMIRVYAARSLGMIGSEEGLAAVEQGYEQEEDPAVKIRICFGILIDDDSNFKYYEEMLGFLRSNDRRVRYEAALAMRDLGIGIAENQLRAALMIEHEPFIRAVLQDAISNAVRDNVMPLNY